MAHPALHSAYRKTMLIGNLGKCLFAFYILLVETLGRCGTASYRQYGMAMAVSTKITLFTPAVAVSDEGTMPTFWTNFLSISNANSTNIRKSIHYNDFMY